MTADIHLILENPGPSNKINDLMELEKKLSNSLEISVIQSKATLTPLFRNILCNLVKLGVHFRDVVSNLIEKEVSDS